MMDDLFAGHMTPQPSREEMAQGATVLRGYALDDAPGLLDAVGFIERAAPFRRMTTPGGFSMSVAMTNCGELGWVTDKRGYRYEPADPVSGEKWPAMPGAFLALATKAAMDAGYDDFIPNACLINKYGPGAKMSLHQDKDEKDFSNPIVSVSLGLPATFQFGGLNRSDAVRKYLLQHGDVVVWGGSSRLFYHGILTLKDGVHDSVGRVRINLTFRRAA